MLGVFDSGVGGLTVLKAIHDRLPGVSTLYLGDNARMPYGGRDPETIYRWTCEGVRHLFDAGCPLVVLACNTVSAVALRRIQQEVVAREHPGARAIGIIRPVGEYLAAQSYARVGLFATPATVASGYYREMMNELGSGVALTEIGCPELAHKIELGEEGDEETRRIVRACADKLLVQTPDLDAVVLACTHYPLVERLFRERFPVETPLLIQSDIAAASLADYLDRHSEIQLDRMGHHRYLTTGDATVSDIASHVYGAPIMVEPVDL